MTARARTLAEQDRDAYGMLQQAVAPHLSAFAFGPSAAGKMQLGVFDERDEGRLLAACVVMVTPAALEVLDIAVDPEHRRHGLGRILVTDVLAEAQKRRCDVWLEVRDDNAPARALYADLGFIETGRRGGYYRDPAGDVDAVLMTKHCT